MNMICERLRVGETEITVLAVAGNYYIPYAEFMEAVFAGNYLNKMKKVGPLIENYIFLMEGKKHITIMALPTIFKEIDGERVKQSIMSQIFQVRITKPKAIDSIEIGLKSLQHLNNTHAQLYKQIDDANEETKALCHDLENTDDILAVATVMKAHLTKRRKIKYEYKMINAVKTCLDKYKINYMDLSVVLGKLAEIRFEIETSKTDPVYFKRDGSNKVEMAEKLAALKEKFKGVV